MVVGHSTSARKDYADRLLRWANIETGSRNFRIVAGGTSVNNDPRTYCSGALFFKKR